MSEAPAAPARQKKSLTARLAPVSVVLGLVLSAFGLYRVLTADSGSGGSTDTTQARPPTSVVTATAHCENTTDGYTLDYPADWYTNLNRQGAACARFDPKPFEPATGAGTIDEVSIRVIDVALPLEELQAHSQEIADRDDFLLESTDTTVGGKHAVTLATTDKQAGFVLGYEYLVDLGDHTLVLQAQGSSFSSADFDVSSPVLDTIAKSLTFV